jgi:hypothetical protein
MKKLIKLIFIINLLGVSFGLIFAAFCVSVIGMYGCFYFLDLEQSREII